MVNFEGMLPKVGKAEGPLVEWLMRMDRKLLLRVTVKTNAQSIPPLKAEGNCRKVFVGN